MNLFEGLPANLKNWVCTTKETLADGYIRPLNEIQCNSINQILKGFSIWNGGIPFATTVFGDVLSWEDGYVVLYKMPEEDFSIILAGTKFFFSNISDVEYQKDYFDMPLYKAAIAKFGKVDNDHCYILEPIPKLGGNREEKYLNTGELIPYLALLTSDIL